MYVAHMTQKNANAHGTLDPHVLILVFQDAPHTLTRLF